MNRDKRNLVLDVYDYTGTRLCRLYDNTKDISGQATDVFVMTERNGWRELSFTLPSVCTEGDHQVHNYRLDYLKGDYRIRLTDDEGIDWFIISEPKVTHQAFSKNVSVTAGHVSQILKTKNLGLEFSDDKGNNVGTAYQLLQTILNGTNWKAGHVDTFLEKDGKTEKVRSMKAAAKSGAFKLITTMCGLFDAKPVFHGNTRTVDILPMNPFTQNVNGGKPDISKADGIVELHYGKNVKNVTRKLNTENIVTKLYAYGAYGDDIHGYCGIDECKHTEHVFTVAGSLTQGSTYCFEVEDDSGMPVRRHFTVTRDIAEGTRLIWSMLDPASEMYIWDETSEIAYHVYPGEKGIVLPAEHETKKVQNWFSFVMDFNYYRDVGLLTDDMLQAIAVYQRKALAQYEESFEQTTTFADALTKLSEIIGSVNFCKLAVKSTDLDENYIRLNLDMSRECGVYYRSDYSAKASDYFEWNVAESINAIGDPSNDVASVIYIVHDTNPVTWDKVFIKKFDDDKKPTEITLWNGQGTISVDPAKDRFYLFGSDNINGWLGALEIADESTVMSLNSLTKIVTVSHPVYFSDTEPPINRDELNGYGWWWKYKLKSPVIEGEAMGEMGELQFCSTDDGDTGWHEVRFTNVQPSRGNKGDYWFNWASSTLYKYNNGWAAISGTDNSKVSRLFGSVYRSCRSRDQLYQGVYQYYTYEVTSTLNAGNYYMQSDYDTKWVFTLKDNLNTGDQLRYNSGEGWLEQIRDGVQTTIEVKNYRFDNVSYPGADDTLIEIQDETYRKLTNLKRSGDIRGILAYMDKFPDLADEAYMIAYATSKEAQGKLEDIELTMTEALGDLYREGWWQKSDYVDGDEDKLYDDAIENLRNIAKPEVDYTVGYLDTYSANKGMEFGASKLTQDTEWPDLSITSAAHLVDPEIGVNAWAYLDVVKKCYDKPWQTQITINTNMTAMAQHSFTDVLTNIANVASEMKGKTSLIDRATALTSGGKMAADRLQGAIDAAKLKIFGGASTWYTDEMGNMVFVNADNTAAMTLTGNGLAIASSKDAWGNWNWTTAATGEGLVADAVTTGYLSAERIQAGSIGNGHLSQEVTDKLGEVDTLREELQEALIQIDPDKIALSVINSVTYQENLDERLGFRLEIISTSDVLSAHIKQTVLTARVWKGSSDVTDAIADSRFAWKRISSDTAADVRWNAAHKGLKSITITTLDVYYSATYTCELSDD